jgi:hypothetical protein
MALRPNTSVAITVVVGLIDGREHYRGSRK